MLVYTTLYIVLSHLVVHIVDLGLSRTVGATAVALIGGASVVGRVTIGHAADRVGRVQTFAVCSAVMGFSTLALPALETAGTLLAFAGVYGLAYGSNGALLAPLTADLFGRENINAVLGLTSLSLGVSGFSRRTSPERATTCSGPTPSRSSPPASRCWSAPARSSPPDDRGRSTRA